MEAREINGGAWRAARPFQAKWARKCSQRMPSRRFWADSSSCARISVLTTCARREEGDGGARRWAMRPRGGMVLGSTTTSTCSGL